MVSVWMMLWLASAPTADEPTIAPPAGPELPAAPVADVDRATEAPTLDEDATSPSASNPDAALHQLAAAHALRTADDLPAAIQAASHALDNDPELAAAYLTRAQMRAELATDTPPPGRAARASWARTLRAAADDLQAYMDRAPLDETSRDAIAVERDRLRAMADAH